MHTRHLYWVVLVIILSAWFANNPVKEVAAVPAPKPELAITKVHKAPVLLGVENDQWIVGGKCNIEHVNDAPMTTAKYKLKKDTPLRLVGWALDIDNSRLPESVIIYFLGRDNSRFFAPAKTGFARADVRDYFSVGQSLGAAGFETNIDLYNIPEGEYILKLIMKFNDDVYICDNGRKVVVR